jgi:hypothetical protein
MHTDREPLRRVDGVVWIIIATIAAVDVAVALAGWFRIAADSLLKPGFACGAMAAGGWIYRRVRPDPRLASALTATAQIVAFAAVAAPLSYIAASAALPLQDAILAQWDRSLGLDWPGLLGYVTARPLVSTVLSVAYASFLPQTVGVVLALSFSGQSARLRAFIATFVATSLITIGISMLIPAQGAWLHYGIDAAATNGHLPLSHTSWPVFLGLRDGSYNLLSGIGSEGIITFPSLHAALGVVFACALWTVPMLRIPAVALNLAMIAATPIEGSHHFSDVIAGTCIAGACWIVMLRAMSSDVGNAALVIAATDAPTLVPVLPAMASSHAQPDLEVAPAPAPEEVVPYFG